MPGCFFCNCWCPFWLLCQHWDCLVSLTALWSWPVSSFRCLFYKVSAGFVTGRPGGSTATCFVTCGWTEGQMCWDWSLTGSEEATWWARGHDGPLLFLSSCPFVSTGSASRVSTNHRSKILGKNVSRKFPKAKLGLLCTGKCSHSIYVVLCIRSGLEMT